MDEATVTAAMGLATAALPFAVAGILWLRKRLKALGVKVGISDEQGDLIIKAANVLLAVIKSKAGADAAKIAKAEEIVKKIIATWDDEAGTTAVMEGYLGELETILKEL
jgi:hypothetical protein